jgi:hypothetical protein
MGATICRERGEHRFVTVDPYGTDVDVWDECVDCGTPARPEPRDDYPEDRR